METLSLLFTNATRVKLMRLFLFNTTESYNLKQLAERTKCEPRDLEKELPLLVKAGMIVPKKVNDTLVVKKGKKTLERKVKVWSWHLDLGFEFLLPLQNLLINIPPLRSKEMLERLSGVGKLKLVIVAGVFIQDPTSRIDLLVVGDNIKKGLVDKKIKVMESEIGKELNYAAFETADFQYRLGVCDKLVSDIIDYPHERLLDKLNPESL